ncbi:unnamed protein product [Triticum turgidum subsp. durum]|uniref:Reverse transcriptase zinc-binding domain-containing protein n=1 Tax=Triticum turgidum subsp. durum TaxID=4567 RepID=A0A9R0ZZF0_TRITD|nr:unnamed protein product [Triticum turgidum subsp. durum]
MVTLSPGVTVSPSSSSASKYSPMSISIHGQKTMGANFNWGKLWALPLPGKILHFLWRLVTYSLPLRMKLKQRGLEVDTRCPVCFRLDEDGGHCFLKCKFVKKIWGLSQMEPIRLKLLLCTNPLCLLEEVFRLNEEECMKVCILLWLVWHQRNKANAGEKIKCPDDILSSINYHTYEYRSLKQRRMIPKQTNIQKWTPPPGAGNLEHVSDAFHAEALAILNALNATAKMGFNQVIFEMDSTVLKQAISSEDYDLAPLGALFQEIKFQLRIAFENVKLYVCPMSCNNAAHVLAAHEASLGDGMYEIWLGQFPELVMNSVAGDLTSRSL